MPLVFIVVLMIVVFISAKTNFESSNKENVRNTIKRRKTNTQFEIQCVLDLHFDQGLDINQAYVEGLKMVRARGFEPCIPLNEFTPKFIEKYKDRQYECFPKYESSSVLCISNGLGELSRASHGIYKYDRDDVYRYWPKSESEWYWMDFWMAELAMVQEIGTIVMFKDKGVVCITDMQIDIPNFLVLYTLTRMSDGKEFSHPLTKYDDKYFTKVR